jgi:hypothetical protein
MRIKRLLLVGGLLAVLLLSSALSLRADSSGDSTEPGFYIIILGIIEDPDPIPTITCEYVLDDEGGDDPLNVDGSQKSGGRPDAAYDPATGSPVVTWASFSGGDSDVAVNVWSGESWGETAYLSSSVFDDLDPRAHIDALGETYIVWWKNGSTEKIYLVSRAAGAASWKNPRMMINGGRRPSVVRYGDKIAIAYERDRAGGGQEVAIAYFDADGGTFGEVVGETARMGPLDTVVHTSGQLLWVDWKHSEAEFAYSVLGEGGWSDAVAVAWTDHSLDGEQVVRRMIRGEVLSP